MAEDLMGYKGEFRPSLKYADFSKETLLRLLDAWWKIAMQEDVWWHRIVAAKVSPEVAKECNTLMWVKIAKQEIGFMREALGVTDNDVASFWKVIQNDIGFPQGLFDLTYIPRHIYAILFRGPVFLDEFPYFEPSFMGLALFFTTPAFLYMFRARLGDRLCLAALAALVLTALPIVTYGVTGFLQFGYRFSLDFLPFMAILTASGMRHRLDGLKIAVIALCFAINLWGTLCFHKLDWIAW